MDNIRLTPRFSLNKLAEYLVGSPRRRRRLILDQIESKVYKTVRYDKARAILQRFVCDPTRNTSWLQSAAARLRDRAGEAGREPFEAKCLRASARAIEAFLPIASDFRYSDVIAVPGARQNSFMMIGGVKISVLPDVTIIRPGTERQVGAIKFHISATYPLSEASLRYAALLLFRYAEERGGDPSREFSEVVDVFGATYESTPRATKRMLMDVEAACEEIAERWPHLIDVVLREQQSTS